MTGLGMKRSKVIEAVKDNYHIYVYIYIYIYIYTYQQWSTLIHHNYSLTR
jgi:hypothetical protein